MQIAGAQTGQSPQFNGCHTRHSVAVSKTVAAIPVCEYRVLIKPIAICHFIRRLHKLFLIIEHAHVYANRIRVHKEINMFLAHTYAISPRFFGDNSLVSAMRCSAGAH